MALWEWGFRTIRKEYSDIKLFVIHLVRTVSSKLPRPFMTTCTNLGDFDRQIT